MWWLFVVVKVAVCDEVRRCLWIGEVARKTSKQSEEMVCIQGRRPSFAAGSSLRWPNLLGIGTGKSGSTATAEVLHETRRVIVGHGRKCCYGETYFLTTPSELRRGLAAYSEHFRVPETNRTVAYYDKTPRYSSHLLAPYRARAVLTKHLRFVFTTREPLELDASFYLHASNKTLRTVPYFKFVTSRIAVHEQFADCRRRHLEDHGDIYNSSRYDWFETAEIEAKLVKACGLGEGFYHPAQASLMTSLAPRNLRRWTHVFPDENSYLCLANEDLLANPESARAKLLDFVGIPRDTLRRRRRLDVVPRTTAVDRLFALQLDRFYPTRDATWVTSHVDHAQSLLLATIASHLECADLEAVDTFCGFMPPYYERFRCV
ncbi:hypothetical protein CTAYLR_008032 [Chrysophaeum taylorii]|uniref:Sulfotransferase domain-containing protein n=1 Tax=Chrysophaeum taylorii TaxID=2483200 RepID=A0AAD7U709_9STRA|nr:hypothetical protein CTAYLR_008032 [Chrysophaeum taylorii]